MASVVKNLPANAGDPGWIPGSGRSPGEGNGNPLQYSSLETPMARGDCQAIVLGSQKSQTRLRLNNTKRETVKKCSVSHHASGNGRE